VDVRYLGTVTQAEVAEIEVWADAHHSDVDHVTIGDGAVAVYKVVVGQDTTTSAVAIRYPGRLTAALDEACWSQLPIWLKFATAAERARAPTGGNFPQLLRRGSDERQG
jgi:hypothetical protein